MTSPLESLLPGVAAVVDPIRSVDLDELGQLVGLSPGRAQRVFTATLGTSPKQLQRRTRLELGALLLVSTKARIVDVAFACGFDSHEGFTRAFHQHFGSPPRHWRQERADSLTPDQARLALHISHCNLLYGRRLGGAAPGLRAAPDLRKEPIMSHTVEVQTKEAVPFLYMARKVDHDKVGEVLGEVLPTVFTFVMEQGLAPAGHPVVRYTEMTPASFSIEAGIPLVEAPEQAPPGDTGVLSGELPAGPAAVTVHHGPYDTLREAYGALEQWIDASDHEVAGPPWESYLTDPGEVPDPANWRTEVAWPLR